jgi:hypothetical protein
MDCRKTARHAALRGDVDVLEVNGALARGDVEGEDVVGSPEAIHLGGDGDPLTGLGVGQALEKSGLVAQPEIAEAHVVGAGLVIAGGVDVDGDGDGGGLVADFVLLVNRLALAAELELDDGHSVRVGGGALGAVGKEEHALSVPVPAGERVLEIGVDQVIGAEREETEASQEQEAGAGAFHAWRLNNHRERSSTRKAPMRPGNGGRFLP